MKEKGMKWSLKSGADKPFQNIEFSLIDRKKALVTKTFSYC